MKKTSAAVRSTDNTSTSLARKLKLLLDIKYFASKTSLAIKYFRKIIVRLDYGLTKSLN